MKNELVLFSCPSTLSMLPNQVLRCHPRLGPPSSVPCMVVMQRLICRVTCPNYDISWTCSIHSYWFSDPSRRMLRNFLNYLLSSSWIFFLVQPGWPCKKRVSLSFLINKQSNSIVYVTLLPCGRNCLREKVKKKKKFSISACRECNMKPLLYLRRESLVIPK